MMAIAVIAVCLGVAHENLVLGIIVAVAVAPALVYTVIVAAKSKAKGRPMAVFQKLNTFLAAAVAVPMVAVSAVIASRVIYVDVGNAACGAGYPGFITALVIGGTAGVATAAYMTYYLFHRKGRRRGNPRLRSPKLPE